MGFGIYIHVPFCARKCPYCDFYSVVGRAGERAIFVDRIIGDIGAYRDKVPPVTSVYFGGGTPNLIGGAAIGRIIRAVNPAPGAEITVECNPESITEADIAVMAAQGVNRISLGVQSCAPLEKRAIGRVHTEKQVEQAVAMCRQNGIENISLDVMVGLPHQTVDSAAKTMDLFDRLDVEHISVYMLSVEADTPFGRHTPVLPSEDETVDLFVRWRDHLKERGYDNYEISNFAKPGRESRHNCLYWQCGEYLGFGPAAHSFYGGKRTYFERDLPGYLSGRLHAVDDGPGGGFEERVMLGLRLKKGLDLVALRQKFPAQTLRLVAVAQDNSFSGLVVLTTDRLQLTPQGFLLSNTVIGNLL